MALLKLHSFRKVKRTINIIFFYFKFRNVPIKNYKYVEDEINLLTFHII